MRKVTVKLNPGTIEEINERIENGEYIDANDFFSKAFKSRYKNIKNRVVPAINRMIEKDSTLDGTRIGYQTIFKYVKNEIKNGVNLDNPDHILQIFDTINRMTSELNTKKLYVSYPKRTLKEYNDLNLVNKLKDIVVPKFQTSLHEQDTTEGGNCHNWTLLYKEIFDELKIENKIILFEPQTAHSMLLIKLNGTYFIADTEGQNKFNFNKLNERDNISIGNHLTAFIKKIDPLITDISQNNRDIKDNFRPAIYSNKSDFIDFIDSKKRDYFLLEYNDFNENTSEKILKSFMISFNRGKIIITIEGIFPKNKEISIGIDKIPKNNNMTNIEIIKYITKRTNNLIFKDEINKIILEGIISKIPEGFIQNNI